MVVAFSVITNLRMDQAASSSNRCGQHRAAPGGEHFMLNFMSCNLLLLLGSVVCRKFTETARQLLSNYTIPAEKCKLCPVCPGCSPRIIIQTAQPPVCSAALWVLVRHRLVSCTLGIGGTKIRPHSTPSEVKYPPRMQGDSIAVIQTGLFLHHITIFFTSYPPSFKTVLTSFKHVHSAAHDELPAEVPRLLQQR